MLSLPITKQTSFVEKDRAKFQCCTKLIARGSPRSSSHAYAKSAGALANTGTYIVGDVVGISAEGRRAGRIDPDWTELHKAIQASVSMFVTDSAQQRNTPYNIGEQQVTAFLQKNGYVDKNGMGHWTRLTLELQNNNNKN